MKKLGFILLSAFLIAGCASQRQKPVCAEIEYRLNHSAMSPDQREWTRQELEQCRAEQEEYAKSDSLTNKFKKSIYELYADSKKDSVTADSAKVTSPDSAASLSSADTAKTLAVDSAPDSAAADTSNISAADSSNVPSEGAAEEGAAE